MNVSARGFLLQHRLYRRVFNSCRNLEVFSAPLQVYSGTVESLLAFFRGAMTDFQDILTATTPEKTWEEALSLLKKTGDHRFTYLFAPFSRHVRFFTNRDDWITSEWVAFIRAENDNIRQAFETAQTIPYTWSSLRMAAATRKDRKSAKESKESGFYEKIAAAGYKRNLCLPIRALHPRQQGALSIMTKLDAPELDAYIAAHYSLLYALTHILQARFSVLCSPKERETIRLSRREKDCLRGFSAGLRNNRIAEKLGISESTVEFHTINARRKLSAKTREEALCKALMLGILQPVELIADPAGT